MLFFRFWYNFLCPGWVDAGLYFALRLIQDSSASAGSALEPDLPPGLPSLRQALIGFGIAAGVLVVISPLLVSSSAEIAVIPGLGTTFVGTTLVALVTSLPELVTTIAAARLGADDMAIGNLFGSNMFNMFALGLTDVFLPERAFPQCD